MIYSYQLYLSELVYLCGAFSGSCGNVRKRRHQDMWKKSDTNWKFSDSEAFEGVIKLQVFVFLTSKSCSFCTSCCLN